MNTFLPGERLAMARTIVKLGGMDALLKSHPKVAESILARTLNRTVFHTSHNRMKSGPYAKRKTKRNKTRDGRIVTMANRVVAGRYKHSYDDIAAEQDVSAQRVSQICRKAGIRRTSQSTTA